MATQVHDAAAVAYNQRIVIASTVVTFLLSNGSYIARLVARKRTRTKLQSEDWMMGLALPFSYIPAACLLYGLTVGLGKHELDVPKADLRKFNISLFVLQRGNPPCLLCVKTAILLLYVRLFPTQIFKKVAFGVWLFTLGWAISTFTSNLFQCLPVAYFWDKTIPGGHCLPNALITVGMTNGVLSFVGDLIILSLPIPMIWKLQINRKRKLALIGTFLLGGFVCVTSVLRFIALAQINIKDITFTQVDPGIWTYIELGIGITSGNLPLLRPLFGDWLSMGTMQNTSSTGYGHSNPKGAYNISRGTARSRTSEGFMRMDGTKRGLRKGTDLDIESLAESGSDIELHNTTKGTTISEIKAGNLSVRERDMETRLASGMGGIRVKTEVEYRVEEVSNAIEKETARVHAGRY